GASSYDLPTNKSLRQKNLEADATNPNLQSNIYSSIEDVNKEHVYDEINSEKANNVRVVEEEYDHLDYTRATSGSNPNYTRMTTIPRTDRKVSNSGGARQPSPTASDSDNNSNNSNNENSHSSKEENDLALLGDEN
ncbi:hypothetical protein Ocin01_09485, partial [Orchesella cincta]